MSVMRAILLPIALIPSLAAALTMTPFVASQTTCQYCFFPDPVVVLVRDGSLPAPGVPVTFSASSNSYIPNAGNGPWTVLTDSQGEARPPSPGYVGETFGSSTVTASSLAAGSVTFDLTVAGSGPAFIGIGYNLSLTGVVNNVYSQQFVARVFGADGQPLPNAAVVFGTPGEPGPNVVFAQGTNVGFGQASSLGYAVAPQMTANGTTGHAQVVAMTLNNVGIVYFDFTNSAAGAASIEPLSGTTPQSTRVFAMFPEILGALVRDSAGTPVKDAAVRFTIAFGDGYGFFLTEPGSTTEAIVMTGADGRALAPARVVATNVGTLPFTADVPGVSSVAQYQLDALPGPPERFDVVSGNFQRAIVNTTYPLPWTVRALDAGGSPVPYAAVQFYADPSNSAPSGRFAGRNTLWAMADAQGIAVSPLFTANGVVGSFFGSALGFAEGAYARFDYENVTAELDVRLIDLNTVPFNAPVGGAVWMPLKGYVSNRLGQPVAGAGVTWQADATCGSFGGQATYRGVTDSSGIVVSPPLQGVAPKLDCFFALTADGATTATGVTVHVFSPQSLYFTNFPAAIDMFVNSGFVFAAYLFADGLPVYYPATVSVTTGKSGATATVQSFAQSFDGLVRIGLLSNGKLGSYDVILGAGPAGADIPVTQKNKPH